MTTTEEDTMPEGAARRTPLLDRLVGDRTGDVLAWLAKRARTRGDAHEFAHLYGAIVFGNSAHDSDWPCALAYVEGYVTARHGEHRAFTIELNDPCDYTGLFDYSDDAPSCAAAAVGAARRPAPVDMVLVGLVLSAAGFAAAWIAGMTGLLLWLLGVTSALIAHKSSGLLR